MSENAVPPSDPTVTMSGKDRLEFPANIAVRTAQPLDKTEGNPTFAQLLTWDDRLPFVLIVETKDAKFLDGLAALITKVAAELRANPDNAKFEGTNDGYTPADLDASLNSIVATGDSTTKVES